VYFEKEIVSAIGNLSAEEDRVVERIDVLEEKYRLDKERELRMDAHRFTLMEDVDRLEDILEAIDRGGEHQTCRLFVCSGRAFSCCLF
jgi:UDP-N-acetylglucosamine 2-epimerase